MNAMDREAKKKRNKQKYLRLKYLPEKTKQRYQEELKVKRRYAQLKAAEAAEATASAVPTSMTVGEEHEPQRREEAVEQAAAEEEMAAPPPGKRARRAEARREQQRQIIADNVQHEREKLEREKRAGRRFLACAIARASLTAH